MMIYKIAIAVAAFCVISAVYYQNRSHSLHNGDLSLPRLKGKATQENSAHNDKRRTTAVDAYKDLETKLPGENLETDGSLDGAKVVDSLTSDVDEDSKQKKKPIAVLHIGPPKTASSSVQYALRQDAAINAITDDGYSMPWEIQGTNAHSEYAFASCFFTEKRKSKMALDRRYPLCPEGELSLIEQLGEEGKNVFLSCEDFSAKALNVPKLADFLEPIYDVTVVYAHRWFHDWIFSMYHQFEKGRLRAAHTHFDDFVAARGSGAVYYIDFVDFFNMVYRKDFQWGDYTSIYTYRQHFDNVITLDYNDKNTSIQQKVWCDGVPNADNACEYFSSHVEEIANAAEPAVYYNIAYGANMLGQASFCSIENFQDVVEKIKHYQQNTLGLSYSDFPMRCLDDDILERLIEVSIEHRRDILTNIPLTKAAEEEVRKEYWMNVKKKSCNANIEAILELPEWKEFFDALGRDSSCEPFMKEKHS